MGNPHPTKSKPCKIGRKHTNGPSTRVREKLRRGQAIMKAIAAAKQRKRNELIRRYWLGELATYPC